MANEVNASQKIIADIPNTNLEAVIQNSDIIIIAQKHTTYKNLDFGQKEVIDCVNLLGTSV